LLRSITSSAASPTVTGASVISLSEPAADLDADSQADNAHPNDAQAGEPVSGEASMPSDEAAASRVQQTLTAMTEAMCRLISRIHFDQDLHMRATVLFNRLEQGIKLNELLPAFEEMVELIMCVVGTKQEAFQNFLNGLNQRLDALQNLVKEAGESQGTFSHEAKALSESLQQQMQDLRAEVMKKDHPTESIKDRVLDKVDGLMATMQHYLVNGHTREQHLNQQLDQLNHQVQTLEQQAIEANKLLENQQQQALIDPLTKVPNRQAYTQRIEQEYLRFKRYNNKLALLVLDVDHFKILTTLMGI
jgi:diguanylate cyclase